MSGGKLDALKNASGNEEDNKHRKKGVGVIERRKEQENEKEDGRCSSIFFLSPSHLLICPNLKKKKNIHFPPPSNYTSLYFKELGFNQFFISRLIRFIVKILLFNIM